MKYEIMRQNQHFELDYMQLLYQLLNQNLILSMKIHLSTPKTKFIKIKR